VPSLIYPSTTRLKNSSVLVSASAEFADAFEMFKDCYVKTIALCAICLVVDAVDDELMSEARNTISASAASRLMRSEIGQPIDAAENPYQLYSNLLDQPMALEQGADVSETDGLPAFPVGAEQLAELSVDRPNADSLASHSMSPDEISKKMLKDLEAAPQQLELADAKRKLMDLVLEKTERRNEEEEEEATTKSATKAVPAAPCNKPAAKTPQASIHDTPQAPRAPSPSPTSPAQVVSAQSPSSPSVPLPTQVSPALSPSSPSVPLAPAPASVVPGFPQDCRWYTWSAWSFCSKTCDGGKRHRSRSVAITAANGGKQCSGTGDDYGVCNEVECPLDCKWGTWSYWSDCTASCGGGTQQRQKPIQVQNNSKGKPCNPSDGLQFQACSVTICARDCQWSEWSSWGQCSVSCAGGIMSRQRSVQAKAVEGGNECEGMSHEEKSCNNKICPKDCLLSDWTVWEPCSASCGNGTSLRKRSIVRERQGAGADCQPPFTESRKCDVQECPVNCVWSDWSDWTACTASCGNQDMRQTSSRTKLVSELYGGQPCSGDSSREQQCALRGCPVDCEYSTWTNWSVCSTSCGGGTTRRQRAPAITAKDGGLECSGGTTEARACSQAACPIDCKLSDWTSWSECSRPCGNGTATRYRSQAVPAAKGGRQCASKMVEFKVCQGSDCIAPEALIRQFNYTQVTGIAEIAVEDPVAFASNPIIELVTIQVIEALVKKNTSRVHISVAPDLAQPRTVKVWWSFLVPNKSDVPDVLHNLLAVQNNPVVASKALRSFLQRADLALFQNVTQFIVLKPDTTERAQPKPNVTANISVNGSNDNMSDQCEEYGVYFNGSRADLTSVFGTAQKGFCVDRNGADVNVSSVSVMPHWTTSEASKCCLKACFSAARDALLDPVGLMPVTGCEVIWNQSNQGCYIHHSSLITKGNGHDRHLCWIANLDALNSVVSNGPIKAKNSTYPPKTPTNKTKSTRVNGIVKLDVPTPSTFAESSTDPFATVLADLVGVKKDEVHISPMPDVALSGSAPRGGLHVWFSLVAPSEDTQEKADAAANGICQVLTSKSYDSLSADLNTLLGQSGFDNLASSQVTEIQCTSVTNSSRVVAQPQGKAQKVTGTMELVVQSQQDSQQFASDPRATEGVRTTLADFADTDVEHVQVSLYPPLPTLTPPSPPPSPPDADSQASAALVSTESDTLQAWFVITLPAEPVDAAQGLENKLKSLETTLAELKLQNHMMDQGLDAVVHLERLDATWQRDIASVASSHAPHNSSVTLEVKGEASLKPISQVDFMKSDKGQDDGVQSDKGQVDVKSDGRLASEQTGTGIDEDDDSLVPTPKSKDAALMQDETKALATSLSWPVLAMAALGALLFA